MTQKTPTTSLQSSTPQARSSAAGSSPADVKQQNQVLDIRPYKNPYTANYLERLAELVETGNAPLLSQIFSHLQHNYKKYFDENILDSNLQYRSLWRVAVTHAQAQTVALLLNFGIKVSVNTDKDGHTALHLACCNRDTSKENKSETIRLLIAANKALLPVKNKNKQSPLFCALDNDADPAAVAALIDNGADLFEVYSNRYSLGSFDYALDDPNGYQTKHINVLEYVTRRPHLKPNAEIIVLIIQKLQAAKTKITPLEAVSNWLKTTPPLKSAAGINNMFYQAAVYVCRNYDSDTRSKVLSALLAAGLSDPNGEFRRQIVQPNAGAEGTKGSGRAIAGDISSPTAVETKSDSVSATAASRHSAATAACAAATPSAPFTLAVPSAVSATPASSLSAVSAAVSAPPTSPELPPVYDLPALAAVRIRVEDRAPTNQASAAAAEADDGYRVIEINGAKMRMRSYGC